MVVFGWWGSLKLPIFIADKPAIKTTKFLMPDNMKPIPYIFILLACVYFAGCCNANYCAEGGGDYIKLEIHDATSGTNLIDSLNLKAEDIQFVSELSPLPSRGYEAHLAGAYFEVTTPDVLLRDHLEDHLSILLNGSVIGALRIHYNDGGEKRCCDYASPRIESLHADGGAQITEEGGWRLVVLV